MARNSAAAASRLVDPDGDATHVKRTTFDLDVAPETNATSLALRSNSSKYSMTASFARPSTGGDVTFKHSSVSETVTLSLRAPGVTRTDTWHTNAAAAAVASGSTICC